MVELKLVGISDVQPLLIALIGMKIGIVSKLGTHHFTKSFGTFASHHDMLRLLHNSFGQKYGARSGRASRLIRCRAKTHHEHGRRRSD